MTKTCTICGEEKGLEEFHAMKSGKYGKHSQCKKCSNAKRSQRTKDARPSRYGITWDDYDRMLEEQDGRCAICLKSDPGMGRGVWSIDHDHETGRVRGLLCGYCNTALGKFEDNIANLTRAQAYLETR